MSEFKNQLFSTLFTNFFQLRSEIQATLISKQDGTIIAGNYNASFSGDLSSILTTIINPILEKILLDITFKKFGIASINKENLGFQFIKVEENLILSVIVDDTISIETLTPYSYFLAEKVVQILAVNEGDSVQLDVPSFEYGTVSTDKLKNQLYQMNLAGREYWMKILLLGKAGVGKTSIAQRFVNDRFPEDYRATLGLNILSREYKYFGSDINLSLWDIGGQENFERFRKAYYLGAQAVFICFDLTDRDSYEKVNDWFWEFEIYKEREDYPIILIGNKSDLVDQRKISYQEGVLLSQEINKNKASKISYIETSALNNDNIDAAFNLITHEFIAKNKEVEEDVLKNELSKEINYLIKDKRDLTFTFITEDSILNPGLQIIDSVLKKGGAVKVESRTGKNKHVYTNGVVLKNFVYDNIDISDTDVVLLVFNPMEENTTEKLWKDIINQVSNTINQNVYFIIAVKESEKISLSHLVETFKNDEKIKKNSELILSFVLVDDYRQKIYNNFINVLKEIKYLQLAPSTKVETSDILKDFDLMQKQLDSMTDMIDNLDTTDIKFKKKKEKDDNAGKL